MSSSGNATFSRLQNSHRLFFNFISISRDDDDDDDDVLKYVPSSRDLTLCIMHDVSEDLPWNESKEDKTEIMNGIFVEISRRNGRSSDAARKKRVSRRDLIACFTFQCYRRFLRRIELLIFLKAIAMLQRANLTKYFLSM